jgi:magnesium transporter
MHSEDLAGAIERFEPEEAAAILSQLDPLTAGTVLFDMATETAAKVIEEIPDDHLAACLDLLPMDDAVDLREKFDEERYDRLLQLIPPEDSAEIKRLLAHPEGTVGRLMTEHFFSVSPDSTMEELLLDLRQASEDKYETVNDVYVLDETKTLIGVFSLRKALRANPEDQAEQVMRADPEVVSASDEDLDAARTMARYGYYALPVVDDAGHMIGVFAGDDAQEVIREGETEQVLALSAVSGDAESYLSLSMFSLFKRRIPWLLVLFLAENLTGWVMRHYGQSSLSVPPLMFFVPLLIGAGGNVGAQVTTTITRALALEEVDLSDWKRVIGRELGTALMIGACLAFLGYFRAYLPLPIGWDSGRNLSLVVGCALPLIVFWASSVGSLLPMVAKRLGADPAVMSAPFITTFVDATGLIIYFEIAMRIMPSAA